MERRNGHVGSGLDDDDGGADSGRATSSESLDASGGELDGWAGRDGRSVRTHFAARVTPIMFRVVSYAAP